MDQHGHRSGATGTGHTGVQHGGIADLTRMIAQDLDNMEEALGFALPADYKEVMLNYPFSSTDAGYDMLSNEPVISADPFNQELKSPDVRLPFMIGGVPGKLVYYMDADRRDSPVFVRDLKEGTKWEFRPSLAAFVEYAKHLPPRRITRREKWGL